MRYWVYINNKVDGPYDETKLVNLKGFSQETLICSEEAASNGGQDWVKAGSIFEFDEVPVQPQSPANFATQPTVAAETASETHNLLSKLDALTQELSYLHRKLDSMQTHLDETLEENKRLSEQLATQETATPVSTQIQQPQEQEPALSLEKEEEKTPTDTAANEVVLPKEDALSSQASSKEEELIIRSALDSIYGEKPIKSANTTVEETFQDLLPQKEEEAVEKIEEELTFTPVEEKTAEPVVKEALITTPSSEEAQRDELINELTASPKEDILDQIIQEHQTQSQEQQTPQEENKDWLGAAAVGAAAVAGLASVSALGGDKQETPAQEEPLAIATDKDNPSVLEEVLPADQLPPDVELPAEEKTAEQPALNALPQMDEQPQKEADQPSEQPTEEKDPAEDTVQELVPGAVLEKKEEEPEGIYEKPQPEEEEQAQEKPEQPEEPQQQESIPFEEPEETEESQSAGILTEKDLEDAFGPQEEAEAQGTVETSFVVPDNGNPNELTEIELKEGSTYLISDFVPPAQFADNITADPEGIQQGIDKKQETIIQDMLTVSNKAEKTQVLPTQGLPDDLTANRVSLENTIQAKRGASLDIKTAPMVPEPANAQRLDVDDLDDVNAQHDMKTSKLGAKKLTKIVVISLVGLLALIILYVALGLVNLLPDSINLFAPKEVVTTTVQTTEEFFQNDQTALPASVADNPDEPNATANTQQALDDVQAFALPNGFTLKQFVENKHPAISADLITWEIADAVDPDNYAITIKVPPENPQNFKTVYRFNYDMQNGTLEPTISDAKNLLDQAYGSQA